MELLHNLYQAAPFYFILAGASTVLFCVSMASMFLGGDMADSLSLEEGPTASDLSFQFISLHTILALCMGAGWGGLTAFHQWGLGDLVGGGVALIIGLCLMSFTAFILFQINKLNNIVLKTIYTSLGSSGQCYMSIPANGDGEGKVQLVISGQQRVVAAITQGERIEAFTPVEVIGIKNKNTIIVRAKLEKTEIAL
jgi:hypothetical protein